MPLLQRREQWLDGCGVGSLASSDAEVPALAPAARPTAPPSDQSLGGITDAPARSTCAAGAQACSAADGASADKVPLSTPDQARATAGSAPTLAPVQPRAPCGSGAPGAVAEVPAPAAGPAGSRQPAAIPGPERRPGHLWGGGGAPDPYRDGVNGAARTAGARSDRQLTRAGAAAVPLAKRLRQAKRVRAFLLAALESLFVVAAGQAGVRCSG